MTIDATLQAMDWRVEQAKAERLELLYSQDGRHQPSHPSHGVFTGLIAQAPHARGGGNTNTPSSHQHAQ